MEKIWKSIKAFFGWHPPIDTSTDAIMRMWFARRVSRDARIAEMRRLRDAYDFTVILPEPVGPSES